jgi:hypothetical protein
MPYVSVDDQNSGSIDRYYDDHGVEAPGVITHDHPLSGGFRQPTSGDDDKTFAAYLDVLLRL